MNQTVPATVNSQKNSKSQQAKLDEHSDERMCKTIALVDDFYLCQTRRGSCLYALSYGTSFLCRSPERHKLSK